MVFPVHGPIWADIAEWLIINTTVLWYWITLQRSGGHLIRFNENL